MPSGSHGGSSGSHGGSHSGGSHSHGSSFGGGGYHGHSRGPTFIYFGRTRYVVHTKARPALSFFTGLILFAIFLLICCSMILSTTNTELKEINADYVHYQNMIKVAQNSEEDLIINGTVISKFYNSSVDKWYITYYFTDNVGNKYEGYTFSVYTLEQAEKIVQKRTIELAIDYQPIDSQTDSIPTDYLDMPLEQDGEYVAGIRNKNITKKVMIITAIVIVVSIGVSFLVIFKNKIKVVNNQVKTAQTQMNRPSNTEERPRRTYCDYCGAEMPEGETKCRNCGAGRPR